jgi:hypothetical protein
MIKDLKRPEKRMRGLKISLQYRGFALWLLQSQRVLLVCVCFGDGRQMPSFEGLEVKKV